MVTPRRRSGADLVPLTITRAQIDRDGSRLAQVAHRCRLVVLRNMLNPEDGHRLLAMLGVLPERPPPARDGDVFTTPVPDSATLEPPPCPPSAQP
jgi:hypothetical protein